MPDMPQMSGRKGFATAVLGAVGGGGLALLGAYRVWWRETVPQPAPLRPEEIAHTGASLVPLLPALGLVAIAAAGGLLATRGRARRVVGGLLGATAVALVAIVVGRLGEPVGLGWPLACLAGAVLVGLAGALAVRYGHRWPVMGSRYGRGSSGVRPLPHSANSTMDGSGTTAPARQDGREPTAGSADLWDALDRGQDLTNT